MSCFVPNLIHLFSKGAFLSPPSEPYVYAFPQPRTSVHENMGENRFVAVFEKEILTMFGVTTAWAWSCLAIKLANLARKTLKPNATIPQIFSGQFLEAAVRTSDTISCTPFLLVNIFQASNNIRNIPLLWNCFYPLFKSSTWTWTFHACYFLCMYLHGHLPNGSASLSLPKLHYRQDSCHSNSFPRRHIIDYLCARISRVSQRTIRETSHSCASTSGFRDQDTEGASTHVTSQEGL